MRHLKGRTVEHIYFTGTGTAVDIETGEALVYAPASTHRVVSNSQSEAYREREEFKGHSANFTFADMDEIGAIIGELSPAQCGYLLLLQCYVDYADGMLVDSRKQALTTAQMMDVLQLKRKRTTFYDFLRVCLDHGIITKDTVDNYYVNPRYHFRGASRNRTVIRSYTARIKEVYREVNAADIGLMYRMLPYVHYGTNALCKNPYESDPKNIEWFNGRELAAILGVHEKSLSRSLPRMKFGGEYVIARLKFGSDSEMMRYFFNPNVFYRKSSAPDDTLIAMFSVKR